MNRESKSVCYEPDKGPLWVWIVYALYGLMLVPVYLFALLFVSKPRAQKFAGTLFNMLDI